MRINSSGIGKTKMKIRLSPEEKGEWKDRMLELGFTNGMADGVRECMRIALGYGWRNGEIVYEQRLHPPTLGGMKASGGDRTAVVSTWVDFDELKEWKRGKISADYKSIEGFILNTIRNLLFRIMT